MAGNLHTQSHSAGRESGAASGVRGGTPDEIEAKIRFQTVPKDGVSRKALDKLQKQLVAETAKHEGGTLRGIVSMRAPLEDAMLDENSARLYGASLFKTQGPNQLALRDALLDHLIRLQGPGSRGHMPGSPPFETAMTVLHAIHGASAGDPELAIQILNAIQVPDQPGAPPALAVNMARRALAHSDAGMNWLVHAEGRDGEATEQVEAYRNALRMADEIEAIHQSAGAVDPNYGGSLDEVATLASRHRQVNAKIGLASDDSTKLLSKAFLFANQMAKGDFDLSDNGRVPQLWDADLQHHFPAYYAYTQGWHDSSQDSPLDCSVSLLNELHDYRKHTLQGPRTAKNVVKDFGGSLKEIVGARTLNPMRSAIAYGNSNATRGTEQQERLKYVGGLQKTFATLKPKLDLSIDTVGDDDNRVRNSARLAAIQLWEESDYDRHFETSVQKVCERMVRNDGQRAPVAQLNIGDSHHVHAIIRHELGIFTLSNSARLHQKTLLRWLNSSLPAQPEQPEDPPQKNTIEYLEYTRERGMRHELIEFQRLQAQLDVNTALSTGMIVDMQRAVKSLTGIDESQRRETEAATLAHFEAKLNILETRAAGNGGRVSFKDLRGGMHLRDIFRTIGPNKKPPRKGVDDEYLRQVFRDGISSGEGHSGTSEREIGLSTAAFSMGVPGSIATGGINLTPDLLLTVGYRKRMDIADYTGGRGVALSEAKLVRGRVGANLSVGKSDLVSKHVSAYGGVSAAVQHERVVQSQSHGVKLFTQKQNDPTKANAHELVDVVLHIAGVPEHRLDPALNLTPMPKGGPTNEWTIDLLANQFGLSKDFSFAGSRESGSSTTASVGASFAAGFGIDTNKKVKAGISVRGGLDTTLGNVQSQGIGGQLRRDINQHYSQVTGSIGLNVGIGGLAAFGNYEKGNDHTAVGANTIKLFGISREALFHFKDVRLDLNFDPRGHIYQDNSGIDLTFESPEKMLALLRGPQRLWREDQDPVYYQDMKGQVLSGTEAIERFAKESLSAKRSGAQTHLMRMEIKPEVVAEVNRLVDSASMLRENLAHSADPASRQTLADNVAAIEERKQRLLGDFGSYRPRYAADREINHVQSWNGVDFGVKYGVSSSTDGARVLRSLKRTPISGAPGVGLGNVPVDAGGAEGGAAGGAAAAV